MHNSDGSRPKIRPAVSNRFDNSTYYEYLEQRTPPVAPDPQPAAPQPAAPQPAAPQPAPQQAYESAPEPVSFRATEPSTRSRGALSWMGIVALGAVIAVAGVAVFIGLGPRGGVEPAPQPQPPQADASGDTDIVPGSSDNTGVAPSTVGANSSPDSDPDEDNSSDTDARQELASLVEEHDQQLKSLEGKWVVQLSAKQVGTEVEGTLWSESKVLEEFRDNEAKYGDLALLKSSDWSTFRLKDYWVTVIPTGYDSPEPALKKCRDLQLDRDNCFAKLLSTSQGPEGATKLNDA